VLNQAQQPHYLSQQHSDSQTLRVKRSKKQDPGVLSKFLRTN
jgi:hypothetical protein